MKSQIERMKYKLKTGAPHEIGTYASPKVVEIKFIDIIVKEGFKEEFLQNLAHHASKLNLEVKEPLHKGDSDGTLVAHGVDGKGFNTGILRRMMQWAFRMLNCRTIDMSKIKPMPNAELQNMIKEEGPWSGYLMVLGELPDGIEKNGRENS